MVDSNTCHLLIFFQFSVIYYRLHMLYMKIRLYYLVLVKLVEIVSVYIPRYTWPRNNTNKQG